MTKKAQSAKDGRVEERNSKDYPAPWTNRRPLKWILKSNANAFGAAVLIGAGIGIAFLAIRARAQWPYDLAALAFTIASFVFALLVLYVSRSIVFRLTLTTEKIDDVANEIGTVQETLEGMQSPPPDSTVGDTAPPTPPGDNPDDDRTADRPVGSESIQITGVIPLSTIPPEALEELAMNLPPRFRELLSRGKSEGDVNQLSICLEYDRYDQPAPRHGWRLGVYGPNGRIGGIRIHHIR